MIMDYRIKRIIYTILYIGPFILGLIGYRQACQLNMADCVYESIRLYGMSRQAHDPNVLLTIAEYWAPIMTAWALITAFSQRIYTRIKDFVKCRCGAMAVYGDNDVAQLVADTDSHGIFHTQSVCRGAKIHLVMFDDDQKNIAFYNNNREALKGKKVYIKLAHTNPFLLNDSTRDGVYYFNVNDVIARQYWLGDLGLEKKQARIAIIGSTPLTDKMLNYGLLNNILATDQSIEYHIWGIDDVNKARYEEYVGKGEVLNDCNTQDKVVFHDANALDEMSIIKTMDRVILTDEEDLKLAQLIMQITSRIEIHWFSSREVNFRDLFECESLVSFGSFNELLNRENVTRDNSYIAARKLHDAYKDIYDLDEWEDLSAFKREDNIAATDYNIVRNKLYDMTVKKTQLEKLELCQLEHIRWNRFHYLHGWTKGERNNALKTHPDLVPFRELSETEQLKDWDVVQMMNEIK